MAMANVKGKGRLSEILGTGAHRRPTHYRSSARLTHAERRARKTVVDLSAMPERVDQQAELDAAVLAGIKHRDSVLAVHDNIERHERELNAILKHHQIHLYGQKDKKYLMVQSSFDAWKIMVHHNRRVRALRRRRRELEAKRPPPQKNRGHGAFRKMGKSPKSSPTPPRRRLDSTPDAIRRKLLTMTDAHELFHVGTGAHHDQSPEKLGQSGRWETKRFGGYHPKLQAIENGDDVPETNDDDDDGDDDDDDDDTSKKVVEGIPEIGHRPLLQRGEGHSYLSKSATKRLPLTSKRARKGYYKGVGSRSTGRHTSKGKFIVDERKVVVPDLEGFALKPYVAAGVPKMPYPLAAELRRRGGEGAICSAKQNVDGREAPEGGKKTPTSKSEEDKLEVAIKYKRRYQNVFSEGVDAGEIAKTAAMEKDATVTAFLIAALRQNFVFASLEDAEVSKIVEFMAKTSVGKGTDVIKQGEQGDYFYIVEEGKFDFMVKGKVVGSCGKKDSFGELALLYGAPRAATVRATTAATVWQLDRVTFRSTVASGASKQKQRVMDSLSHVTLLEGLTDDQLERVADAVQIVRYPAGKRIIQKNETGNVFYMIQEGAVDCTDVGASNQFKDLVLKDGEYFGERALLTDQLRAANVTAKSDVTLLALDREAFVRVLGPLRKVLDDNLSMRVLSSVEILSKMSTKEQQKAAKLFKEQSYKSGEKIIKQGDQGEEFFVIKNGTARRGHDRKDFTAAFGSLAKIMERTAKKRNDELHDATAASAASSIKLTELKVKASSAPAPSAAAASSSRCCTRRRRTACPEAHAKFYGGGVCSALAFVHEKNIAYRDLKPENIMLDSKGYPKVVDFGFAKIVSRKTYTLCGTPEYLAPEIVLGRGHNKCVVICKNIINGKLVFPKRFARDAQDLVKKLLNRNPVDRLGANYAQSPIAEHKWFATFNFETMCAYKMTAPWVPKIKDALDCSNFEPYEGNDSIDSGYKDDPKLWVGFCT
ncbi:hypothetical protein JL720_14052 [Aureococcus anophagefferens]|nr:hypothetical protein JL720_14052 [Aureococcus anophagefferens]